MVDQTLATTLVTASIVNAGGYPRCAGCSPHGPQAGDSQARSACHSLIEWDFNLRVGGEREDPSGLLASVSCMPGRALTPLSFVPCVSTEGASIQSL